MVVCILLRKWKTGPYILLYKVDMDCKKSNRLYFPGCKKQTERRSRLSAETRSGVDR